MLLQEPVQAAIWDALNHYSFGNAIFLAERLYAEVSNNEALHLLATCYYRGGRPTQAYMLLQKKSSPSPQCQYLMAKCCLAIKKYAEVERVLAGSILTKPKSCDEIESEFGPVACHVFCLLAQVYSKTDRVQKACDYYRKSLKLNPLLWKSYEALCHLGAKVDPNQVFSMPAAMSQPPAAVPGAELPASGSVQAPSSMPPPLPLSSLSSETLAASDQDVAMTAPHTTPAAVSVVSTPTAVESAGSTCSTECTDYTPDQPTQDAKSAELWAPRRLKLVRQESQPEVPKPIQVLFPEGYMSPSFGVMNVEASCDTDSSSSSLPFISPTPSSLLSEDTILDAKAPSKKVVTRKKQSAKPPVFSLSGNSNTRDVSSQPQCPNPPSVRRSSRLFGSSSSVKENNKSQGKARFTSPKGVGGSRKTKSSRGSSSSSSKGQHQELNELNKGGEAGGVGGKGPNKTGRGGSIHQHQEQQPPSSSAAAMVLHMQQQSLGGLLRLLLGLGKAYAALSQYECSRAVELFEELPEHQLNTAWVLSHVGRAYFERGDFQKAASIYSEVRQLEPYQLLGMDRYSTSLWHLQREVELSALAHDLAELDKNCPQTWCATGNCFSLQKEHDVAIKFFKRAIQVDPDYAYAYTLLAHEYVFIEELDKALACFRNGLRVDSRHYNAWYGVGMIYYKQEKFSLAEVHFRRALAINPQSCALLCHVGVAQHAQKKTEQALVTLNRAIASDPRNSLCKFHKASILLASDRHKEALEELEELKQIIPSESLVYFLMGKVHKKLGNTHLALMNFSWAMDLDPKGVNNQIKEAIDKRYATEEDDTLARLTESMPESSAALGEEEGQEGGPSRFLTPEEVHQDLQAIFGSEESL